MSYLSHNFVTNRVGGDGDGSRAGQSIYEESSTPKFALGEKLELADGRCFRYGYTSAAINAAELVSHTTSEVSLVDTDNIVLTKAASLAAGAVGFSPEAGSTQFQITLGSVTENQYAGGLFQVVNDGGDGIGEGIQYRIKANSATGFTPSGKVDIELSDPINVTMTAASDIAITGGLWNQLRASLPVYNMMLCGVSPIAFTANYYGWFQTAGVALISSDGAIAIGANLTLSDDGTAASAGHVQLKDAETEPLVGFAMFASDDDAHVAVLLQGLVP